jgi:Mn-dependent DtxR family transcriptional regulator
VKWFRFYTEVLHDPKVQRLHPTLFKVWVNVLCLFFSRYRDQGALPQVEDVAFALRMKPAEAEKILTQLEGKGLLDRADDGGLSPHNWTERQRNSDDGATRQKRYIEKKKRENELLSEKVTSLKRHADGLEVDVDRDIEKDFIAAESLSTEIAAIKGCQPQPEPAAVGENLGPSCLNQPKMTLREISEVYRRSFGRLVTSGGVIPILEDICRDYPPEAIREAFEAAGAGGITNLNWVRIRLQERAREPAEETLEQFRARVGI